jgi:predicted small metal-binding protein
MTYVVHCKDTGADCDAVLRADTMDELQQKIAAHGKDAHGMDIASMPEDEKQKLMSLVTQE